MTRADLWVLGNLTIDDVVFADGTTVMGLIGGNAIYAALGGRLWSACVGLSARVGPDFPMPDLEVLAAADIQLALNATGARSIHNWALYEGPDRRRFINWLDSGSYLDQSLLEDEIPEAAVHARVCHVAPMPLEVQVRLIRHLARMGTLISLDPHEAFVRGAEAALFELLGSVDLFLPSRQEAALLFGSDAPEEAARAFAACGPRAVAIKLGGEGSLVFTADLPDPVHVPAVPVTAVDPTGAGDAFCGAFGVSYSWHQDPVEAACHATVAASFVVERSGALAVLPFNREVAEQRLRWLADTDTVKETHQPCAWTSAN